MKMEAYIIARRDLDDETALEMGLKTVGKSISEAWSRHIHNPQDPEKCSKWHRSTLIQRWSDKGYGPRKISIEIISN